MDNNLNQTDALLNSEMEVSDMTQVSSDETIKVPGAPAIVDVEGRPTLKGEELVETSVVEQNAEEKTEEEKLNDVMNEILSSEDKESKALECFNGGKLSSEQIEVLFESQVIDKEKYNALLNQDNSSIQNLAELFNTVKVPGAPAIADVEGRPTLVGEEKREVVPTVEEPVVQQEPEAVETPVVEPALEVEPTQEEVESPVIEEPVIVEENNDWNELINSVKERMANEQPTEAFTEEKNGTSGYEYPSVEDLYKQTQKENINIEENTEAFEPKFVQASSISTDTIEKNNFEKPSVEEIDTEREVQPVEVPSSGYEYPSVADFYNQIKEENAKDLADLQEKTDKHLEELKNESVNSDVKSIEGTPTFVDVEGSPRLVGEANDFEVSPVEEKEFSEITNEELDKVISNIEVDDNKPSDVLENNEQLKNNIIALKEEIENNPLKGQFIANDIRDYMVKDVEKDLAFIREYKKKVFIPSEIKEMISLYNTEIEKLTDKKEKLDAYRNDYKKQDLRKEKSEINEKINECRANSYKILKDENLSKEEKQEEYKKIKENQDNYQRRLDEINNELLQNVYSPNNTAELINLTDTINEYKNQVNELKDMWSKHDSDTEEFLTGMNNVLNNKQDDLEKLAVFDFNLKEEADKALTYYDNQDYDNASNVYNIVKDKQEKIKKVHDDMEEELLLLERRKTYLEDQLNNEENFVYTKPDWMNIKSDKLDSLREIYEKELSITNNRINDIKEIIKNYSFDGIKYSSVYDNPDFDYIHNFVVIPETSEYVSVKLDDFVKSKGITPVYIIESELEEAGLTEEEIKQNLEYENHPETILQDNLYYDEEGVLHGMDSPLVKDVIKNYNFSLNDVYKYMDLFTHFQGKINFETNPDKIEDSLTRKDYEFLDTINLYDAEGNERTSFPELRSLAFESNIPLEVLLDVVRNKDRDFYGGLVKEEKSLPAKVWDALKRNWKKVVAIAAGVVVSAALLIGLSKCHDKDIDEEELKEALNTPNEPKVEEESEASIEDVNESLSNYGVYVDNSYAGEGNSSSHNKSNDNSSNKQQQKENPPEEKDDPGSSKDEEEIVDDRPYLEEGSYWGFSDGQIYYNGTVIFTNNGVKKIALLPDGSYSYEDGKMYFDANIFNEINKYDSINAVYSDGNGMLKLEDVKDYTEENVIPTPVEDNTEVSDEEQLTPENPGQEIDDNNLGEENTQDDEQTKDEEAPGEYDPDLPDVEDAVESGDITEEDAKDAVDSVLDELNNIETDIPEDEDYDTKASFSSDLQKLKEIREQVTNIASEQNAEESITR